MGRTGCYRKIAYSPLPSQRKFHDSKARFKGYSGSIGSGKSQALCQEAIKLSILNKGRTGLLGAPTYPMLRDATLATLTAILDQGEVPYEHSKAENTITFLDGGSKILLRPVEEFERLRGTNLAWFGVDELTYTQEESWLRLEGRLRDPEATRLCGFAVWTPKGHDWVYRRFIRDEAGLYETIFARPFENKHILGKVPDFYERLKASYDDKFYRQEVLGEYLAVESNRVYTSFDREDHVRELRPDGRVPLLWALDFNVDPMCSIVGQKIGDAFHVIDEIVISRASTLDACEEFFARYSYHAAGLVVYGDASGQSLRSTGRSDYEIIRSFFARTMYRGVRYEVPAANPLVRERVQSMNAQLRSANGSVQLYVAPKCTELIRDLEEVVYKPGTTLIDKDRDSKRTHLSDALGYLVWQEKQSRVAFGEQPYRLL